MRASLLVRNSLGEEHEVPLEDTALHVGRAPECAIRADDRMVSRKHAVIRPRVGRWAVEDLGSANGTFVNEARVWLPWLLTPGDVMRCGSLLIRFVATEPIDELAGLRAALAEARREGQELRRALDRAMSRLKLRLI